MGEDPSVIEEQVLTSEFTVASIDGKTTLAARLWLPPARVEPRLAVQLVHGMAEHIGRYDAFARYLAARGIAVVGHDHAGHGKSSYEGKDPATTWGILRPGYGADQLVEDVGGVFEAAKASLPDVPHALFGHSMGSFVARVYAARHGSDLSAAVFCGTGWQPAGVLAAGRAVASAIERARGWDKRSQAVDGMAVGAYGKGFEAEQYPSIAWLSRDVSVREAYDADPACGFMFSVGAYHELFRLIGMSQDKRALRRMPPDLPILVTSGSADPVGGTAAVRKVEGLLSSCGCRDVTARIYEGARHEILNETNKGEVMNDITTWLLEKGARR